MEPVQLRGSGTPEDLPHEILQSLIAIVDDSNVRAAREPLLVQEAAELIRPPILGSGHEGKATGQFAVSLDPPRGNPDLARRARLVMPDVCVVDADHHRVGRFRSLRPIRDEAVELLPVQEIAERQGMAPNGGMAGAQSPEAAHLECPRRLPIGHTCPEFREQIAQFGCRSARDQFAERKQSLRHPNEPEAFACLEPASAEPVPPKHGLDTFRPHIFHSLRPLTIRAWPTTFRVVGRLIRDDRHLQALEQAATFLQGQANVLVPELLPGEYADFTRSPGDRTTLGY